MGLMMNKVFAPITRVLRGATKNWAELEAIFNRTARGWGDRKATSTAQLKEYKSWVFTAVNAINHRFKSIDFVIKRDDSGKAIDPEDPAFETIWRPFKFPNRFQSFRQLSSYTQLQYDLMGAGFLLILRSRVTGKPAGFWCLRTNDFVRMHRGSTTTDYLKAFEFRNGKVYPENDIVYFHHEDPRDPLWFMSPIQALAVETDINRYAAEYERDLFAKGAVPDIILATDKKIDKDRVEAIQDRWQEKYGGPNNFHGVAVVDGGLKPTTISVSHRDLEVIALSKWNQDTILSAYQVPAGKVGLVREVNKANAFGIDVTFNSECIWPRLKDFDEAFTRGVLHEFDQRLYMEHANPIPRDKEFELEEGVRKIHAGLWSRNEARRKMDGLEGIGPGGDQIRVNLAEVVVGAAPAYQDDEALEPSGPPDLSEIQEPKPEPVDPLTDPLQVGQLQITEGKEVITAPNPNTIEGRDQAYQLFKRQAMESEAAWYPLLTRFFGKQREEVLRRLQDNQGALVKVQSEKGLDYECTCGHKEFRKWS